MKALLLMYFCSFIACKKSDTPVILVPDPPVVVKPVPPAVSDPTKVPADAIAYEVGTGSGNLTIDGSTLKLTGSSFFKIKGGTYKSILIKNLSGTTDKPIFVKNVGQVIVTESMATDNISNVIIAGDNTSGITYGFTLQNISYRGLTLNGKMSGVTIKNFLFINIGDNSITGSSSNGYGLTYKGTAETRTDNLKILYCTFDNAGSISFGGTLNNDTGEDSGLFKNVEIAYNTFQNSPGVGSVCYISNAQDYDIHHNTVNNINQNNNNHNGVFFMMGNGIFHDNKFTNYQGNSIRMWLYSRGSTPSTNLIYNNVCYNTRKYGGFELQGFDRYMYPGKSTFANAKVYNNTVGHMNTSRDWDGQVLDLYNIKGTLEYYNNLGFDLWGVRPVTNMMNNMSDTKVIKDSSNKYFAQQGDAVTDVVHFTSKYPGVGASGF
jgi:hypothetical protein